MPVSLSGILTAVFVLLSLVAAALGVQQWRSHGERRWEAMALTVSLGCLAAFMYLNQFDGPHRLSGRSWAAFAATMLSLAWANTAARARWRRKLERVRET